MIKNKTSIVIIIIAILLLSLTACGFLQENQKNKTHGPSNNHPTKENLKPEKKPVPNKRELSLPSDDLQKGDTGNPVRQLQLVLNEIGYEIHVNGKFDSHTTWALTDFQLQLDDLNATGLYNSDMKHDLEKAMKGDIKIKPGSSLKRKNTEQENEVEAIENPYDILVLVNKQHALPAGFIPDDLVIPNVRFPFVEDFPKKQMRKIAADALEKMFKAADLEGHSLFAQSGYRSYERQDAIFAANVNKNGEKAANKYSARPGESEHQTGLSMDITSETVNFHLIIEFGETPEGKWVQEHASEFGFIVRYPEGKEDITEYQYEPWHLRYVGEKAAKEMMSNGITLEEYLDDLGI